MSRFFLPLRPTYATAAGIMGLALDLYVKSATLSNGLSSYPHNLAGNLFTTSLSVAVSTTAGYALGALLEYATKKQDEEQELGAEMRLIH